MIAAGPRHTAATSGTIVVGGNRGEPAPASNCTIEQQRIGEIEVLSVVGVVDMIPPHSSRRRLPPRLRSHRKA